MSTLGSPVLYCGHMHIARTLLPQSLLHTRVYSSLKPKPVRYHLFREKAHLQVFLDCVPRAALASALRPPNPHRPCHADIFPSLNPACLLRASDAPHHTAVLPLSNQTRMPQPTSPSADPPKQRFVNLLIEKGLL